MIARASFGVGTRSMSTAYTAGLVACRVLTVSCPALISVLSSFSASAVDANGPNISANRVRSRAGAAAESNTAAVDGAAGGGVTDAGSVMEGGDTLTGAGEISAGAVVTGPPTMKGCVAAGGTVLTGDDTAGVAGAMLVGVRGAVAGAGSVSMNGFIAGGAVTGGTLTAGGATVGAVGITAPTGEDGVARCVDPGEFGAAGD